MTSPGRKYVLSPFVPRPRIRAPPRSLSNAASHVPAQPSTIKQPPSPISRLKYGKNSCVGRPESQRKRAGASESLFSFSNYPQYITFLPAR